VNLVLRQRIITAVKLTLLAVVLVFVVRAIAHDLGKVDDWSAFRPNVPWLLACGVFSLGVPLVQMLGYRALLGAYGHVLPWRHMAGVAWVPPLGKYVPGKVVALLGAMAMLRRMGIPIAVGATVVLMLDALAVLTGLITATPILLTPELTARSPWIVPIAVACIVGGAVVLHPTVFVSLLNLLLRKLKRATIDQAPTLAGYLAPVLLAFAQWLFAGAALWCAVRAFNDVPIGHIGSCIALAACAMTISYLALFAPGGLGVREGIYMLMLPRLLQAEGAGTVALVVVTLRLWQTAIELTLAGTGWWLSRRTKGAPDGSADYHPTP
jgi:glycosyltransferase 2 family protein